MFTVATLWKAVDEWDLNFPQLGAAKNIVVFPVQGIQTLMFRCSKYYQKPLMDKDIISGKCQVFQ